MMTQRHNDKSDYEFSSSSSSCIPCVASCTGNTLQTDFLTCLLSVSEAPRAFAVHYWLTLAIACPSIRVPRCGKPYTRVALKLLTPPGRFGHWAKSNILLPLPTYCSPLPTFCSPLSTYYSPLSTYYSPLFLELREARREWQCLTRREVDDGIKATLRLFLSTVEFFPFFRSWLIRSEEGFDPHSEDLKIVES